MTTKEVANQLVELCRQGKNDEAIQKLYSPDIVSVEAFEMPPAPRTAHGLAEVQRKAKWWNDNHTMHSAKASDAFVSVDKFAVEFDYEVTNKPSGKRFHMREVAIYTVKDGKITHEEFIYGQ